MPGSAGSLRRNGVCRMLWLILGPLVAPDSLVAAFLAMPQGAQTPASMTANDEFAIRPAGCRHSKKYLVSSFPRLKQVAYVHLPDNVWRPLAIGDVAEPAGVVVDEQLSRLYVADPPNAVIYWYQLRRRPDGLLETVGRRFAAVEGYAAQWLAVNGQGDLYFTGKLADGNSKNKSGSKKGGVTSVYRQDASDISRGISRHPVEIYSRSNSGNPNSKAWQPSGIAVDSFYVYWGNHEQGKKHGSIVRGIRKNLGTLNLGTRLLKMNDALDEVRGMAATGTHIFFLGPNGVYGMPKNQPDTVHNDTIGLIAAAPGDSNDAANWNPVSIAFDGDSTLYFTDTANGVVYSLPANNAAGHRLTKFTDAPGVHGVSLVAFHHGISAQGGGNQLALGCVATLIVLLSVLGF